MESAIGNESGRRTDQPEYGSDLAAEALRSLDIRYVALTPGSSFRGLHDSILNFNNPDSATGNPEIIECLHEEISVAIAHGYAKASGKMMAAAVHNVVGLLHASIGIWNAWCDGEPVLVLGGTGPIDVTLRRAGTDWTHTALVQGNLIREFIKWDDQPASHSAVIESLFRANRLALEEPQGPVYVCLDAGLQEEALAGDIPVIPRNPAWALPGTAPAADPGAIDSIAASLKTASWPVIVAGRTGRSDTAFGLLSRLADAWAIPVVEHGRPDGNRLNLGNSHPMNLTGGGAEVFGKADVILALDVKDLSGALVEVGQYSRSTRDLVSGETTVFAIGLDDYRARGFTADYQALYPTALTVLADTTLALSQLLDRLGEPPLDRVINRRKEIESWHQSIRQGWEDQAARDQALSPIARAVLIRTLRESLVGRDFVISCHDRWVSRLFALNEPRQFLGGSGGGGLGYSIGATIGACLAHRETGKIVVDVQGDGDLMFTSAGLWTLAHYDLPALVVLYNNRSYFNSEQHQTQHARFRDRDESLSGVGTKIDNPSINFAALAESHGVKGFGPVDDPVELIQVLTSAVAYVCEERKPALVDVITEPR